MRKLHLQKGVGGDGKVKALGKPSSQGKIQNRKNTIV